MHKLHFHFFVCFPERATSSCGVFELHMQASQSRVYGAVRSCFGTPDASVGCHVRPGRVSIMVQVPLQNGGTKIRTASSFTARTICADFIQQGPSQGYRAPELGTCDHASLEEMLCQRLSVPTSTLGSQDKQCLHHGATSSGRWHVCLSKPS